MATNTIPRVDVGALAATITIDTQERVAEAVSSAVHGLRDQAEALTETQTSTLLTTILAVFDGFERSVAQALLRDLRDAGVRTWGLPRTLADLEEADDD